MKGNWGTFGLVVGGFVLLATGFFVGLYLSPAGVPDGVIGVAGAAVGGLAGVAGGYYTARVKERTELAKLAADARRQRADRVEAAFIDLVRCLRISTRVPSVKADIEAFKKWCAEERPHLDDAMARVNILCPPELRMKYYAMRNESVALNAELEKAVKNHSMETDQDIKAFHDEIAGPVKKFNEVLNALSESVEAYLSAMSRDF